MTAQDHTPALRRYLALIVLGAIALAAAAIWAAFVLFDPTPPRTVAMATDLGGASAEFGRRYRELLARDGIDLRLVPSAGAVDNVARLRDPRSGISVAIVPGGITDERRSPELVSLGTLYYEPLWIFLRERQDLRKYGREGLLGRTISIGPEGSATHALATEFLERVGIIPGKDARLLALPPDEAADKLLEGRIDAAVLVEPWESPLVQRLVASDRVHLATTLRADAMVALYPYLNKLVLPTGVGDLARNRPPADVVLLATKASLVVRRDLHPAIQALLLEAATRVHSGPGLFHGAGQFPAAESIDLPLGSQAVQFYKTGRPFLQRHLPFWLAVLVKQLLVVFIPIVAVLYPLLRLFPAVYGWAMRHRIFTLYRELRLIEDEIASAPAPARADALAPLERLEERASQLRVPLAFRPLLYALRLHIALVRQRLERR